MFRRNAPFETCRSSDNMAAFYHLVPTVAISSICIQMRRASLSLHPDRCHTAWERASLIACSAGTHLALSAKHNHSLSRIRRELEMSHRHWDGMMCRGEGGGGYGGLAADVSQIDIFLHLFICSPICFISNALHATYPGMGVFQRSDVP